MIYLFTGDGGGKTTAALGHALRALGHGWRVVVVQFMKGRENIGEKKIAAKLGPLYEFYQFGRPEFVNLEKPDIQDINLARQGFEFIKRVLQRKKRPQLLILDEINLATHIGLLEEEKVLELLKNFPKSLEVILTGRSAPKSFIKIADGVSYLQKIKYPFDRGIPARKGIEF